MPDKNGMLTCAECPLCKDMYPGKVDVYGNHFCICGWTGNMVYPYPRRERKHNGSGYINLPESGCGLWTIEKLREHGEVK